MGGSLRDGLAYRQAVTQPVQPDIHGGAACALEERLLEMDGPDEGGSEADPGQQQVQFGRREDAPPGVAVGDGGDPVIVWLDTPGLRLARVHVAFQEAVAEIEQRQPETAGFPVDQDDLGRAATSPARASATPPPIP